MNEQQERLQEELRSALRAKVRGIGGSTIAPFLRAISNSISVSAVDAFLEKTYNSEFHGNVYTAIGLEAEKPIIEYYEASEKYPILCSNKQMTIWKCDWHRRGSMEQFQLVATPDLITVSGKIIEIKNKINYRGKHPITPQHALQLVYYMCMLDYEQGSLVYFCPDPKGKTIDLVTEYQIKLTEKQREFFYTNLISCCEEIAGLMSDERLPWRVRNIATILYDYKRLYREAFSQETPLLINEWPSQLDELYRQLCSD